VWGHSGLNVLLLVGIMASLIGATLAFVSLDLNDLRFAPDHKGAPCKRLLDKVGVLTNLPGIPSCPWTPTTLLHFPPDHKDAPRMLPRPPAWQFNVAQHLTG